MKSNNQTVKQSNNFPAHPGSALLVVLGMLSFMLFSGLAFSVYMRQSRLPTSFLRRTVATRQLAKAALAEAIDDLDAALGNDPHPGIRESGKQWEKANEEYEYAKRHGYVEGKTYKTFIDNIWSHRVFFGWSNGNLDDGLAADDLGLTLSTDPSEQKNTERPYYARTEDTVPTLTLEGLAYLPPNLINEARYYSQRTPTAKWHSFWFDSGRYAYTAIDVSDYFDVNRVYANRPRSSNNRISLAHLFEKIEVNGEGKDREVKHTGSGGGADAWDNFMEDFRVSGGNMPLISMADLNVAWNEFGAMTFGTASFLSPFCNYVKNGIPYPGGQADAARYECMNVVTDGWFPKPLTGKTAAGETIYDLANQQPFEPNDLMGTSRYNLTQVMSYTDGMFGGNEPLAIRMNMLTKAALWDYLDQNKVPLSLAIPTCEQVPMICAIQPTVSDVKLTVTKQFDANNDAPDGSWYPDPNDPTNYELMNYRREVTYQIDLSGIAGGAFSAQAAWVYPFLLKGRQAQTVINKNPSSDSFSVDGRLAVFLSNADSGDMSARPGEIGGLHLQDNSSVKNGEILNNSIITFPLTSSDAQDVNPETIKMSSSQNGAVNGNIPVKGMLLRAGANSAANAKRGIVKVTYKWAKQRRQIGTPGSETDQALDFTNAGLIDSNNPPIVPTDGDILYLLNNDGKFVTDYTFLRNGGKKNIKLNLAVWLRVTDADDKTVDLVPACLADDNNLNNVNNDGMANKLGDYNPYPLMRLDLGPTVEISLAKLAGGDLGAFELKDTQLVTGDPRYNHAPEDWQIHTQSTMEPNALAQYWYEREIGYVAAKDGDIYMATSDQGYLQSIYELAFLPRLQNDGLTKNGMNDGFVGDYDKSYNGKIRASNETLMHHVLMWKTYNPFRRYNDVDDFAELGDGRIVSGDTGVKVNPYTDSENVLMAAFANTPHDWRMASTNNPTIWKDGKPVLAKVTQFNEKYAWNGYCDKEKGSLCWDCLQELADKFKAKVRESAYLGNWEDAFRDLGWSYSSKELLTGQQLDADDSELFSVDKKFLYGFWRDSFAVRQQLFLIFVRAEPMMMGGGVSGQVPPQLGARAVALVWRDPTPTQALSSGGGGKKLYNPHRTRILFYHQFD